MKQTNNRIINTNNKHVMTCSATGDSLHKYCKPSKARMIKKMSNKPDGHRKF